MRGALYILAGFAFGWGVMAIQSLRLQAGWMAVPAAISLALVVVVPRLSGPALDALQGPRGRTRRIVIWASLVEAAMIYLAIEHATRIGHPDLVGALIALIVGLHFLPLARLLPAPSYYVTGGALTAVALIALAIAEPARDAFIGMAAATVLWLTALDFVRICRRRLA